MENKYAKKLQYLLTKLGFYNGLIDGIIGKLTYEAVLELAKSCTDNKVITRVKDYMNTQTKLQVTLTAGHGGRDSGAVNGVITEADIAADMRNMVKFYLEQKGVKVLVDGEGRVNLPLKKAIKLAKKSDLAIEFHTNAFFKPTAGGCEALAQNKDKIICQKLCEGIEKVTGIKPRGSAGGFKKENSGQHTRLGYVRAGGIILELFFISNPKELKIYQKKKWLLAKELADVIYNNLTNKG